MTDGTPVVLVHGMGSNFEHNWRRHGWVESLAATGGEVIGFDMPGHGAALPLAETGDSGVARLIELCESYGEVDIVGFSAGSVLSLKAVARRPDLFRRAALMGLADTQLLVSLESMREGAGDIHSPVMRTVRRAAERAGNDVVAVLDWAQRSDAPPSFADLARVTCPVLLILGDQDFLGEATLLLQALPQARLLTLADTDHFATTSRHEAKIAVSDFLAS